MECASKLDRPLAEFVKTEVHIIVSPFGTIQTVSVTISVGREVSEVKKTMAVVENTS